MSTPPGYIGLDVHRQLVMVAAVDAQKQVLFDGTRVSLGAVRELRNLIARRRHLVRDQTAAKNRLHSILHRHNLHLPTGEPFSQSNQARSRPIC